MRFSQVDTERCVKTIRKIEPRFVQYNESHENLGQCDRAKQEVFIHENAVALSKLPVDKLNQNWLKHHRSSLKKDARSNHNSITVQSFLKNDTSSLLFLEE